jgi:peptidoglycan/LPS O-acetylase OafA/YrhL
MSATLLQNNKSSSRICGLDTLRFIAAIWVVFGHCGSPPLTQGLDRTNLLALFVQGFYGNFFAAVPAVIVFFVISGFCIHYPYRSPGTFEILPYLARRYIRIGIPMAAAILIASPLQVNLALFHNSILWSLLAELIYYSIYPLLRWLRARLGWGPILAGSFIASYSAISIHPSALDYSPFGPALCWLIALPCWLLGCRLAEVDFQKTLPAKSSLYLWSWRFGIWFLSWTCSVLRFHSPIGYPWTLNLFAVAVFFWLQVEIRAFKVAAPAPSLEWAGQWSYSIYLMHLIADTVYQRLPMPDLGFNLNWALRMLFILLVSYIFYLIIEKPGHFIARGISLSLRRKRHPTP